MPITRRFLELDRPAPAAAADYLLSHWERGGLADLHGVVVVVPGARAGRRLLEVLVEQADQRGLMLLPPEITTVGVLPELLYPPQKPFASELAQQLAWARALRGTVPDLLAHVIAQPPDDADWLRWLELGKMLSGLHRELAGEVMDFASVIDKGPDVAAFDESLRWQTLLQVQQRYLETLDGLQLWDRQTARRVAIQQQECHTDKEILLIGAVDMDETMRWMLDQVADRVTSLVYARSDWADRFDGHGCLIPEAWTDASLDLNSKQVRQVDGPTDQARAVARRIAEFGGRYRADEITIGAPDERIVPQIERQLSECGLPSRWGPGRRVAGTGVARLLQAVAAYVESGGFPEFAALARHADVYAWIERRGASGQWLAELDRYYTEHLPSRLTGQWLSGSRTCEPIRQVHEALGSLVSGLREDDSKVEPRDGRRGLSTWSEAIRQLLLQVYGWRTLDVDDPTDRVTLKACQDIKMALSRQEEIPESLAPRATAAEAIRVLLEEVGANRIAPPAGEAAIEIVGWLELPLDDAPTLLVTSFNEGFVPKSVNHDLFLPNGLRAGLKLDDNARRYARDAYALSTLLAPWRDLTLVVGRRDGEGNPLTPSRLLFAADRHTVAQRVLAYFGSSPDRPAEAPVAGGWVARRSDFSFAPPMPRPLDQPPAKIRVTGFRSYLACPYRFYLSHILGLERLDDRAEELDGGAFGSLAHEVLRRFGSSPDRDTSDVDRIQKTLDRALAKVIEEWYGGHPTAAVKLQLEQLARRLTAFAAWQAGWSAAGWRIERVEAPGREQHSQLMVDDEPIVLSGRIDRIDVHAATGERAIFDYKTSDTAKDPEHTHRKSGQWVDLQLPLYRHLALSSGISGPVQLGYILLPKDCSKVGCAMAEWSEGDLAEAESTAHDVVRKVRRQEFWPPREPPPDFSEDLAPICLDGVFGKPQHSSRAGTGA